MGCDVMIVMLFGVEEFGFVIVLLVVVGCIMMWVCYLDMCLVGVVIQNLLFWEWFIGKFEFVENFFMFIVEEVWEYLVQLGFCIVNEVVGQVGVLDIMLVCVYWKVYKLDLVLVFYELELVFMNQDLYCSLCQDYGLDKVFDQQLIVMSREVLDFGKLVCFFIIIGNVNCMVGIMFGYELMKVYGG